MPSELRVDKVSSTTSPYTPVFSTTGGALSHRNLIINGAMQVAQRGTSVSSQTSSGYFTVDRWRTNASGGTYNQSQQAVTLGDSTIGDFKYFLRHETTTGDNFSGLNYRIEDVQSVPEGTLTLSFYAKGTNPNAGYVQMIARQFFGTGGSPSTTVDQSGQNIVLTSSWQKFDFQITVPSISGKTLGTNGDSYYQIQLTQAGSDTSTDAWTLDITGVQLELGSVATPFEHRSFGDEILRCQRYFSKSGDYATAPAEGSDSKTVTTSIDMTTSLMRTPYIYFPVNMRTAPTVTLLREGAVQSSGSGTWAWYENGSWQSGSFSPAGVTEIGYAAHRTDAGAGDGNAYYMHINWTASAEL